jgi:hypothetical protein
MAYENTCTNVWPFWYFIPATNSQHGLPLRSLLSRAPPVLVWEAQTSLSMQRESSSSLTKSPLVVAPNLMRELYTTKDWSLCFFVLHHLCALQSFPQGIFGRWVSQFWLGWSRVVHHGTQAPPGASSLLHLLALVGLTQGGEGTSVSVDAGSPWPSLEGNHCNIYNVETWFSFPLRFLFLWLCIMTNFCIL